MIEEVELLHAIRDAPFDDAPRLVYADWLSERGDPRGEFIASQCRRSIESRDMWVELLKQHEDRWAAHVQRVTRRYRFERGFVSHVELDSFEAFLDHRAEIVEWIPIPEIRVGVTGEVVIAPERQFAVLASSVSDDWARGVDYHRVYEIARGMQLVEHKHRWSAPSERTVRCWFPVGLRTLVIEYADDRVPTDLRF